jgi:uncharacterized protein YbjQ (UPF0145 family)
MLGLARQQPDTGHRHADTGDNPALWQKNDIMAGLGMIVGGELTDYTDMMNEARAIATKRMVDEATALEADAVINIRYGTSKVAQGAAEVIVYGTAVKFVNS